MQINFEISAADYNDFATLCNRLGITQDDGFKKAVAYFHYIERTRNDGGKILSKNTNGVLREVFER